MDGRYWNRSKKNMNLFEFDFTIFWFERDEEDILINMESFEMWCRTIYFKYNFHFCFFFFSWNMKDLFLFFFWIYVDFVFGGNGTSCIFKCGRRSRWKSESLASLSAHYVEWCSHWSIWSWFNRKERILSGNFFFESTKTIFSHFFLNCRMIKQFQKIPLPQHLLVLLCTLIMLDGGEFRSFLNVEK